MASAKLLCALMALVLFVGIANAGCASEAYARACRSCSFDENGTMDKTCYKAIQSSAIACYAAAYPVAYANYSQGKCPQIDNCIFNLEICQSNSGTGNDSADCTGWYMPTCYSSADTCVRTAASECGDSPCGGTTKFILLLFGAAAVFTAWKTRAQ